MTTWINTILNFLKGSSGELPADPSARLSVPTIAFVIETALLTPSLVKSYVISQQLQLDRDVWPVWGVTARCVFVEPGARPPSGAWLCVFLDNSDQANALGYHELTSRGLPVMKIFVADVLREHLLWTVTASHEVIETLGDPNIDQVVNAGGIQYARELCDPPEDDRFSYRVGTIPHRHRLSAFITPAWFDPHGAAPFSFPPIKQINAPFTLADGGYIGQRALPDGQWTQRFAQEGHSARQRKAPTSRTMRRFHRETPR